jgi:DNA repair ATPase RecN
MIVWRYFFDRGEIEEYDVPCGILKRLFQKKGGVKMNRIIRTALFLALISGLMFFNINAYSQGMEEEPIQQRSIDGFEAWPAKTLTKNITLVSDSKYQEWTKLEKGANDLSPSFNFDKDWNQMQPNLATYLNEVNKVFAQLNDSQSNVLSNKSLCSKMVMQLDFYESQIKTYESKVETLRNSRQLSSTSFENFDQKANQLYNILSSILKAMRETKSAIVRNIN